MKHIFVLNPAAGRKNAEKIVLPRIMNAVKKTDVEYEIHRTIGPGDALRFVQNKCMSMPNERMRFYAVGGDGTLNETANGAFGFPNVEIALIPAGTGNDFPRMFTNSSLFLDIEKQIEGQSSPIDLIRCNERVFINMLNVGLDCAVVVKTDEMKKIPLLNGSLAYLAGLSSVFATNKGYRMTVELEGETLEEAEYTLVAVGNGAFCGGGFRGVPRALFDDGLLDVSLIQKVNRRTFLSLVGSYRKGTHLENPKTNAIVRYQQCKKMSIHGAERLQICIDGEIIKERNVTLEILPKAILFARPIDALECAAPMN